MNDDVNVPSIGDEVAERVVPGLEVPGNIRTSPKYVDRDDGGGGPPDLPWQRYNWKLAVILLFVTMLALLYIVWGNTTGILSVVSQYKGKDNSFVLGGLSLVTLTLIRMLAILIGAALAFAGLAISFFSHDKATQLAASRTSPGATTAATLTAYSPGIVGIVFGAVVIMAALLTKTTYNYTPPQTLTTQYSLDTTSTPEDEAARAAASLGLDPVDKVISTSAAKSTSKPGGSGDGQPNQ
ncbi:hypothetical protein FEA48_28225 [Pseudomonas nitroreducens]|uniref:Uncharacterized protein n=1 Tax=Pseudomonas nitroreducens TaxID=46680 RepID=A0A5R8ZTJ0_PSENT|nr:hypothetical protein [Pseudomonas nitroreducens]TLP69741.1 hypothetical protein FEA48_28225 [Pseudomonas nitroreducens]